jgi:hypothetical protein
MEKLGTWALAIFVALGSGILSISSFQGWDQAEGSNKMLNLLIGLQHLLVRFVGGTVAGLLFAGFALFVLWAAWKHDPNADEAKD